MNRSIYPVIGSERNLPIYLVGIGMTDYEWHHIRKEGYAYPQIIYTERGKGCLIFDGKEYILTAGHIFFLPAHYPHEYYTVDEVWETHWITFSGTSCEDILSRFNFTAAMTKKICDPSHLENMFKKMFVALKTDHVFGVYTCSALMYQYLIEFYRVYFDKSAVFDNDRSRILMPVFNYIDENLSSDISMEELCQAAGVTPQHLCRIFRSVLDIRPTEYISQKRVQAAKSMLTETDIPIADVGKSVGFAECSYFGAVFKRIEGVSPSEYRKMNNSIAAPIELLQKRD